MPIFLDFFSCFTFSYWVTFSFSRFILIISFHCIIFLYISLIISFIVSEFRRISAISFWPSNFQVTRNEKGWKTWYDKDAPEEETIPDGYNTTLDVFRRLLLVRCWSPDRTLSQAKKYVADSLGEKYAEGFILDVEKVWDESEPKCPMVGLLSMGADPTPDIEVLAKKHRFGTLFIVILVFDVQNLTTPE